MHNLCDSLDLLQILPNLVLSDMIKCFAASNLVLNLDKTNILISSHSTVHISLKKII